MAFEVFSDISDETFAVLGDDLDKELLKGLSNASPILKKNVQKRIREGTKNNDLSSKIKASKPKKSANGALILNVHPSGKVNHPEYMSAMQAAFWLNYGTVHEAPREWLKKSLNDSEEECLQKIDEAHNELLKKAGLL